MWPDWAETTGSESSKRVEPRPTAETAVGRALPTTTITIRLAPRSPLHSGGGTEAMVRIKSHIADG